MSRRIYLASSWRNQEQPTLVEQLRSAGHEVYDFRNPAPNQNGFSWSEIDVGWEHWTPTEFAMLLHEHMVAANGFRFDKAALDWCDTCVLLLPCGRSAHLEAGYAAGQGKEVYFLLRQEKFEPELMYLLGTRCLVNTDRLLKTLEKPLRRYPSVSLALDVVRWHVTSGGHGSNMKDHALRLLHEVVELCIASGTSTEEVMHAFSSELVKANERRELGGNPRNIPEEWADCAILLEIFRHYAGIKAEEVVGDKLAVLYQRQWEADPGGALWRPGHQPKR